MNKIQELMEKRKQAWEGAKAFVEAKKDKDGLRNFKLRNRGNFSIRALV